MIPAAPQQLLEFYKALADENRLKMVGLLHQGEYNVGQLASELGLKEPTISHHLSRLREVGLVNLRASGNQRFYRLNPGTLKRLKQLTADVETLSFELQPARQDEGWIDDLPLDAADRKVLKDYTEQRRLKHIPVKQKKLLAVLRWLILDFEAGMTYSESQVNAILTRYHEDYARLRRELVDFGFLRRERAGSKYWLTPEDEVVA
jgi:biotin operon repressor